MTIQGSQNVTGAEVPNFDDVVSTAGCQPAIVRTEGHCINRLCVSRLENQLWSVAQDGACICRGLRWSGRHGNTALVRFFRLREAVDGGEDYRQQNYYSGYLWRQWT